MKMLLRNGIIVLFLVSVLFPSCTKDDVPVPVSIITPPPPPPPPPSNPPIPDTLSGREFIFNDLVWVEDYDDAIENNATFVTIANRPDHFKSSTRRIEVSFKFDSSSVWVLPQTHYYYSPNASYYWYYGTASYLRILNNNLRYDLIGKKASVRVKVL